MFLKAKADVLEITLTPGTWDSVLISDLVMPALRYSTSGSAPSLRKGRTAFPDHGHRGRRLQVALHQVAAHLGRVVADHPLEAGVIPSIVTCRLRPLMRAVS